ncbi:MAG: hypothetical protein F7C34_04215 [Desulfurococcales archaeon]|nr:hypothetical protein [Desulfurococcales archaeon]
MSFKRKIMNRAIKENLLDQMERSGISPGEASEWLWDDFGKRVPPRWDKIRKAVLSDPDVTPQDLAVFMIDQGVQPEEGAWDALPRRGLRGGEATR